MKKIIALSSVLAALLLMSALPAFSAGTGPYGAFGSTIDNSSNGAVDNGHAAQLGGTGPYGAFGSVEGYNIIPGAERTPMEFAWGTGPYGVFNSQGLVARDKSSKECLVVAEVCPLRGISR